MLNDDEWTSWIARTGLVRIYTGSFQENSFFLAKITFFRRIHTFSLKEEADSNILFVNNVMFLNFLDETSIPDC